MREQLFEIHASVGRTQMHPNVVCRVVAFQITPHLAWHRQKVRSVLMFIAGRASERAASRARSLRHAHHGIPLAHAAKPPRRHGALVAARSFTSFRSSFDATGCPVGCTGWHRAARDSTARGTVAELRAKLLAGRTQRSHGEKVRLIRMHARSRMCSRERVYVCVWRTRA